MKSINEYVSEKNLLLDKYEKRVRTWLKKDDKHNISEKIPFFRDGVVCPEVWFAPGNDFRPLFILKEVSLGIDEIKCLDCYLETWGNQKTFEFIENPFDDVQVGKFTLWRKIVALAKGLCDVHNGLSVPEYDIGSFAYMPGGQKYTGNIKGYIDYGEVTANPLYNEFVKKIAVLEIKKIGGGRSVGSELSLATKYYSEHINPFEDLILEEIELINPTVIICCCKEFLTGKLLKSIESKTNGIEWIYGCHPTMNTIENFYFAPVKQYYESIKNNT